MITCRPSPELFTRFFADLYFTSVLSGAFTTRFQNCISERSAVALFSTEITKFFIGENPSSHGQFPSIAHANSFNIRNKNFNTDFAEIHSFML